MDGQLGLQLDDAALRGGQLRLLGAAQPRLQTPIDPVLTPPGVDRLGADPEIPRDVGDRPPGIDQVERLNRTLLEEWAYRRLYTSEKARRAALSGWLHHYNQHRPHTALGNLPPISRCTNVSGQYT